MIRKIYGLRVAGPLVNEADMGKFTICIETCKPLVQPDTAAAPRGCGGLLFDGAPATGRA